MNMAFIVGFGLGAAVAVVVLLVRLEIPTRFAKWFCERQKCTRCPYYRCGGCKIGYPGGWRL